MHTLGGFSAHAGQGELVAWAGHFNPRPRLYLVHGEPDKMQALEGCGGVQAQAARRLGITERSLWHRIKKLKIQVNKSFA